MLALRWRAGVDRARDEVLAGAALARDQHREIVALQPLNLLDDALHRGARADEAREQRLERTFERAGAPARAGRSRAEHSVEPLAQRPRTSSETAAATGWPSGRDDDDRREPGALRSAADRLDRRTRRPPPCCAAPPAGERAGAVGIAARPPTTTLHLPRGRLDEDAAACRRRRLRAAPPRPRARAAPASPPRPRSAAPAHRRRPSGRRGNRPRRSWAADRARHARPRDRAPRRALRRRRRGLGQDSASARERAPAVAASRPSARWLSAAW